MHWWPTLTSGQFQPLDPSRQQSGACQVSRVELSPQIHCLIIASDRASQKDRGKASIDEAFSLVNAIHRSEFRLCHGDEPAHKFEVLFDIRCEQTPGHSFHYVQVTLEPSSYTAEKFALYQKYQREVHKEEEEKKASSFTRFLVDNPLKVWRCCSTAHAKS